MTNLASKETQQPTPQLKAQHTPQDTPQYTNECELCTRTAAGKLDTTYYGEDVFICHDCKDTEPYLEQIEGMTKCLCSNWFDQASLRTHIHNAEHTHEI
jgi:hypothetical protein